MMEAELFECRDCFHAGTLTIHGRCEACNSDCVISQELIALLLHRGTDAFLTGSPILMRVGVA